MTDGNAVTNDAQNLTFALFELVEDVLRLAVFRVIVEDEDDAVTRVIARFFAGYVLRGEDLRA